MFYVNDNTLFYIITLPPESQSPQ